MIYIIGGVALVILLMGGAIKLQGALLNAEKAKSANAMSANVSLAASIKDATKECDRVAKEYDRQHALDLAAQERSRKAAAARQAEDAKRAPIVAQLDTQAKTPSTGTCEEQRSKIDKALDEAAAVRNP